ncbi:MAG TPA: plastocyanin/azurin family copper-binding protein [Methanoregula sp.]|nr:plastocyanin/azurin family copper-binding protein [Methanoregula sp.]
MKKYAILLIALISGALICGCISVPSSPQEISPATQITTRFPTGPTVKVIIKARAFDPATLTIKEGTTVTWTNEDPMTHRVVHLPEANQAELFNSGPLSSGQSFSYMFLEKDRYNYGDPQIGGGRSYLIIVE